MKPTVPAPPFKRRRILPWILVILLVFFLGLISLSLNSARMLVEARYALKMERLASAVGNALQEHIRTNSIYPTRLKDFSFDDERIFSELGLKWEDVQKLKYYTDGSSFRLTYETADFRFILTGDKIKGISLFEPMTRKTDS
jgi:hypothetical protein